MANIIKEFAVDCSKPNRFRSIIAKQGDMNSRFIKATITADGNSIAVESDAKVVVNAQRADGEIKSFAGTVETDGTVLVPIANWMLEVEGHLDCEIIIVNPLSQEKLSTTKFTIEVESNISNGSEISDDENYDFLLELITNVDDVLNLCASSSDEAKEAAKKAQNISDKISEKLNNGEFIGPQGEQGIQGLPGEKGPQGPPGTTDYKELQNTPIKVIDLMDFDKEGSDTIEVDLNEVFEEKMFGRYRVIIPESCEKDIYMYFQKKNGEKVQCLIYEAALTEFTPTHSSDGFYAKGDFIGAFGDGEKTYEFNSYHGFLSEDDGVQLAPFVEIDDDNISNTTTYSSQKVDLVMNILQEEYCKLDESVLQFKKDITELKTKAEENQLPEFLKAVDISDQRIYVDENGTNQFNFNNKTLDITTSDANSYISDYIPITEKVLVTGFSVQKTTAANGIAFVTYDENKNPLQAFRGEEQIDQYAWRKSEVLSPDDAAYVRLRSRDCWKNTPKFYATVQRYIGAQEKINDMQAEIDSLLTALTSTYSLDAAEGGESNNE